MSKREDNTQRREALKSAFSNHSFTDNNSFTDNHSFTDVTTQSRPTSGTPVVDGCIILGRNGASGNTYTTRYCIDHVTQRRHATEAVLHEECVPCCVAENRESPKSCLWNFIKSEAFLFSLHLTALALGVAKEALGVRELSEDLELGHSLAETFAAMLMITIRMVVGWYAFKELKETAYKYEHISDDRGGLRGRAIKRWRNVVLVIGALMIIVAATCFILFKFLVHLGWTILSNNFAMVVFTVVSGLYTSRIDMTLAHIREDQHKAVLYEAVLLINETFKYDSREFKDKLRRFMKSVEDTEFLQKPKHISAADDQQRSGDMLVAMEMQSFV